MQLPFCWVADHTKLPRSLFKPLDGYVVLFPIGVLIGKGKSKQSGLSLWTAHSFVKLVDLRDYLLSDFLLILFFDLLNLTQTAPFVLHVKD